MKTESSEKLPIRIDDSVRLNWLIQNNDAEVAKHGPNEYGITSWIGESSAPDGVGGIHLATGKSVRECIDKFIMGEAKRID